MLVLVVTGLFKSWCQALCFLFEASLVPACMYSVIVLACVYQVCVRHLWQCTQQQKKGWHHITVCTKSIISHLGRWETIAEIPCVGINGISTHTLRSTCVGEGWLLHSVSFGALQLKQTAEGQWIWSEKRPVILRATRHLSCLGLRAYEILQTITRAHT